MVGRSAAFAGLRRGRDQRAEPVPVGTADDDPDDPPDDPPVDPDDPLDEPVDVPVGRFVGCVTVGFLVGWGATVGARLTGVLLTGAVRTGARVTVVFGTGAVVTRVRTGTRLVGATVTRGFERTTIVGRWGGAGGGGATVVVGAAAARCCSPNDGPAAGNGAPTAGGLPAATTAGADAGERVWVSAVIPLRPPTVNTASAAAVVARPAVPALRITVSTGGSVTAAARWSSSCWNAVRTTA